MSSREGTRIANPGAQLAGGLYPWNLARTSGNTSPTSGSSALHTLSAYEATASMI